MKAGTRLEQQVAEIGDLSREELVALWEKQYGCPPPKGIRQGLLQRSAAWHLQARRLGGFSAATKRALRAAETDRPARGAGSAHAQSVVKGDGDHGLSTLVSATAPEPSRPAPIAPPRGSRLLREWNGRMYAVDVLEKGFVMDGRTYRSLSAVAKRITGTDWSGPRFFGL